MAPDTGIEARQCQSEAVSPCRKPCSPRHHTNMGSYDDLWERIGERVMPARYARSREGPRNRRVNVVIHDRYGLTGITHEERRILRAQYAPSSLLQQPRLQPSSAPSPSPERTHLHPPHPMQNRKTSNTALRASGGENKCTCCAVRGHAFDPHIRLNFWWHCMKGCQRNGRV